MKKLILLLTIVCLTLACNNHNQVVVNSQTYKYLSNDITWKVLVTDEECIEPCTHLEEIKVTGDTIINNVKYRIVDNVPVREEGQKIYCYSWDPLEQKVHEVLIYDFGVKNGDRVRILLDGRMGSEQTYYATVTDVETVTLLDGRKAQKISYDYRATDMEYIGHLAGGFSRPFVGMMIDYKYLCCTESGVLLHESYEGACN